MLLQGSILLEYAIAILLYQSLLELKYIVKFPWNFDVIADASSSRLSWVSVKHKISLFSNRTSLNLSSKCFLYDLVFGNVIISVSVYH